MYLIYFKGGDTEKNEDSILRININKSERLLACATSRNRLFKLDLEHKLHVLGNKILNLELIRDFHSDPIESISTCALRPIILTSDRESIRIWNFIERRSELVKRFYHQTIYTSSLHPYGLHLVVSFAEQINLYAIVDADLTQIKCFPIGLYSFFLVGV